MFTGTYPQIMDEKGRISIPTGFREELGESFYITRGLDGCLFVYSEAEWLAFQQKYLSGNLTDIKVRKIQRQFLASSAERTLDKQGRILIPPVLRELAGIEKDIVVTGVGNRVEIWAKDQWDKFLYGDEEDEEMELEALMQAMNDSI